MRKHLLFVCTANLQRSPTAEELFEDNKNYEASSCGTHLFAEKTITSFAIEWADIIFCMEELHKEFIIKYYPEEIKGKEIVVLSIPDKYYRGDPELVRILKEKLKGWLY